MIGPFSPSKAVAHARLSSGAFVAFGSMFSIVVSAGAAGRSPLWRGPPPGRPCVFSGVDPGHCRRSRAVYRHTPRLPEIIENHQTQYRREETPNGKESGRMYGVSCQESRKRKGSGWALLALRHCSVSGLLPNLDHEYRRKTAAGCPEIGGLALIQASRRQQHLTAINEQSDVGLARL
jgi:hypothetical protein